LPNSGVYNIQIYHKIGKDRLEEERKLLKKKLEDERDRRNEDQIAKG